MLYLYVLILIIVLYMICDVNYVLRTVFVMFSGRLYQGNFSLLETTTMYGLCTFQDCDIFFKSIRMARLLRELDFARYHFYDRTGIYRRSRQLAIKSLQFSTLTLSMDSIPMFVPYKIITKLVYWDQRSLFLEHEVITLHDGKVRCWLVSRQYAIGEGDCKNTTSSLLQNLPGSDKRPKCPDYIEHWLESMIISSTKLRKMYKV